MLKLSHFIVLMFFDLSWTWKIFKKKKKTRIKIDWWLIIFKLDLRWFQSTLFQSTLYSLIDFKIFTKVRKQSYLLNDYPQNASKLKIDSGFGQTFFFLFL